MTAIRDSKLTWSNLSGFSLKTMTAGRPASMTSHFCATERRRRRRRRRKRYNERVDKS